MTETSSPPPLPTRPEPLVTVRNLNRVFDQVHAVKGVSFDIFPGQVVGFIGANGAGKTTTMRMMATLERPTSGVIRVAGYHVIKDAQKVRQVIGWMPDNYGTYANMNVYEYLDFFARAYGLRGAARRARVEEVLDFADLMVLADRPINKLSKGMGQRLCFGRMLLPDPQFLILDEPAAGLDPKARVEFKNLVRILSQRGKTLFISSHILSELAEMCDTLLFIDAGRLVYHGDAHQLMHGQNGMASGSLVIDVGVLRDVEMLTSWAELQPGWRVLEVSREGARLEVSGAGDEDLAEHLKRMIQQGFPVTRYQRVSRKLEDAFVDMVRNLQAGTAS